MRIEIYGGSDDLIEIRVDGKNKDEFNVNPHDNNYAGMLLITTIGGAQGVRVHAIYDGCWSFAIGLLDEDRSLPNYWTFGLQQEHGYSMKLIVDTKDDLVLINHGL